MSCYERAYQGYSRSSEVSEQGIVNGTAALAAACTSFSEAAAAAVKALQEAGAQPDAAAHDGFRPPAGQAAMLFGRPTNDMAGAFRDHLKDLWTMFSVVVSHSRASTQIGEGKASKSVDCTLVPLGPWLGTQPAMSWLGVQSLCHHALL
jgi:hypothetical protein